MTVDELVLVRAQVLVRGMADCVRIIQSALVAEEQLIYFIFFFFFTLKGMIFEEFHTKRWFFITVRSYVFSH